MTPKRLQVSAACAILALAVPLVAQSATRTLSVRGQGRSVPHPMAGTVQVTPADLNQVLQCLMGPNVVVTNAVLTAAPNAAGRKGTRTPKSSKDRRPSDGARQRSNEDAGGAAHGW